MKGARPLRNDEIPVLCKKYTGRAAGRNRALTIFGINTGFRIKELLSLRVGDVLNEYNEIRDTVTVARKDMKRKRESRTVHLNDASKQAIKPLFSWLRLNGSALLVKEPLFMSLQTKNALTTRAFNKYIAKAARNAKIPGKITTHSLRKTFANFLYDWAIVQQKSGRDIEPIRYVSKALGHRSVEVTENYLSFLNEDLTEGIDAISFTIEEIDGE